MNKLKFFKIFSLRTTEILQFLIFNILRFKGSQMHTSCWHRQFLDYLPVSFLLNGMEWLVIHTCILIRKLPRGHVFLRGPLGNGQYVGIYDNNNVLSRIWINIIMLLHILAGFEKFQTSCFKYKSLFLFF